MAIELIDASATIVVTYINPRGWGSIPPKGLLSVLPSTGRANLIKWGALPDISQDVPFYLAKSNNPVSGWKILKKFVATDYPYFLDETANNTQLRYELEYYWLIFPEIKKVIGPATGYNNPNPTLIPDAYGSEIAFRHRLMLQRGGHGDKCYLFSRFHAGTRCPQCWDDITQKRTRSNCPTCLDTGWISGYYNPVVIYVSFGPESSTFDNTIDGPKTSPSKVTAWTGNYPVISGGDILIEANNRRIWEVNGVPEITSYKRVVTKQSVTLDFSTGDDIAWKLMKRLPEEG